MVTISLCMIVRDEEDVLVRCLESVRDLVDEIIIVDTGSTDRTKEIAAQFEARLFDFVWVDDFAAARNAAFAQASCDYCLWLDADDVLLEADRKKFAQLKADLQPQVDVVMLPYNTGFDAQGNVTFSYYRERIVKNRVGMVWQGAVHEVIITHGNIIYGDCAVTHRKLKPGDAERNLRIFEGLRQRGGWLEPRQQFYYGRELYFHGRFAEALAVLQQFLKEDQGWRENKIDACRHCALCLYALEQPEQALAALLASFIYDLPRAEICCDIGRHFFERQLWEQAAYWYIRALTCQRDDKRGGFVLPDAYGFIPSLQLCVCYDRLGQTHRAECFNRLAARFKPGAAAVAYNEAYFAGLRQQGKM